MLPSHFACGAAIFNAVSLQTCCYCSFEDATHESLLILFSSAPVARPLLAVKMCSCAKSSALTD